MNSDIFAFEDNLERVYIENSSCTIPTTLHIPDGVTIYGYSGSTAEELCQSKNITFVALDDPNEQVFSYSVVNSKAIINGLKTENENITIPKYISGYEVSKISSEAFKNNDTLKSIVISSNITSIGDSAFEGCSNLESVAIEEGVTSIGKNAFKNCDSLPGIALPNSVTDVSNYMFDSCDNLTAVVLGEAVTRIGN